MSDQPPHDSFEPPEHSGIVRGVLLAIVVVVIGALLLPSATRAPLEVVASSSSGLVGGTSSSTSSTTTTTRPVSQTTVANAPAPSAIHVLVANATNVSGVASAVATFLGGKGYGTLAAQNALTTLTSTRIYFTSAGSQASAASVASALGLPATVIQPAGTPVPVSSSTGASVVVAAGQDLATRFSSSSVTSTTARG